jgi:hypothetical protein
MAKSSLAPSLLQLKINIIERISFELTTLPRDDMTCVAAAIPSHVAGKTGQP